MPKPKDEDIGKYKYKTNSGYDICVSKRISLDLLNAVEKYFDDDDSVIGETADELEDRKFELICHHAQTMWFDSCLDVEKWVNEYGLVKAMRETRKTYGTSFDDLIAECDKQGDAYWIAHDETFYVKLLITIISDNDLVSVVKIEKDEDEDEDEDEEKKSND
jgi:hypothetical protein